MTRKAHVQTSSVSVKAEKSRNIAMIGWKFCIRTDVSEQKINRRKRMNITVKSYSENPALNCDELKSSLTLV